MRLSCDFLPLDMFRHVDTAEHRMRDVKNHYMRTLVHVATDTPVRMIVEFVYSLALSETGRRRFALLVPSVGEQSPPRKNRVTRRLTVIKALTAPAPEKPFCHSSFRCAQRLRRTTVLLAGHLFQLALYTIPALPSVLKRRCDLSVTLGFQQKSPARYGLKCHGQSRSSP